MERDLAIGATLVAAVLAVIFGAAYYLASSSCESQAEKMGFRHDWGAMQGCMIELKPGQWVPLGNYRVL